jgi:hypothetical protein
LANSRSPGLSNDDPIDARADRPRSFIDPGEIVQTTDDVAFLHSSTTRQYFFVVACERRRDVTFEVHDRGTLLSPIGVMSDRFDRS